MHLFRYRQCMVSLSLLQAVTRHFSCMNALSFTKKKKRRYYTYFLMYDWPWLRYVPNEVSCSFAHNWWSDEYHKFKSSTEIKPVSRKITFRIWASEDTAYAVLCRNKCSLNYRDVIKIIKVFYEKIVTWCFGERLKDPSFWCLNVKIHRTPT
jgi:hypothetical protein